jgi:hypothetical protein
MLTITNEPDDGRAVALTRLHDIERNAEPVPAGAVVEIIGLGVNDAGDVALWCICWHGAAYWAFPAELRPAGESDLQSLQETN